jgi:DNA-binding MarR family transcriptional regulator
MPNKKISEKDSGRFAYEGLERVMHEKARLGILTSLMTHPQGVLFTELKGLCALSDGNLSRHIQALEDAGLIEVWKGFKDRRPQTLCRLTKAGRERFVEYLTELEQVLKDAKAAEKLEKQKGKSASKNIPEGWQLA